MKRLILGTPNEIPGPSLRGAPQSGSRMGKRRSSPEDGGISATRRWRIRPKSRLSAEGRIRPNFGEADRSAAIFGGRPVESRRSLADNLRDCFAPVRQNSGGSVLWRTGLAMTVLLSRLGLVFLLLGFVNGGNFQSADAEEAPDGKSVMNEMLTAYYYPRTDSKSEVFLRIVNRQGQARKRRLTVLRLDETDGGEQSYYLYFHEPPDVQGMSFLVLKHPGRDDDRWLYLPSIDLVKRIAASDKRTSFAGSDFTYEDVSGRDLDEDEHEFLGEESLGGRSAFAVKSTPKRPGEVEFGFRKFWIDRATHLPLKMEHYDLKGTLYKIYETLETQTIQGTPAITKAVMKDLGSGHYTEITIQTISYDVGIASDLFQERLLRRPPAKWIR